MPDPGSDRRLMLKASRIGILSDTHGVLDQSVRECLERCDLILHAGDIGAVRVLESLRDMSDARVEAVVGNNDTAVKWPAADDGELESLPEVLVLDLPHGRIAMEHGHRIWDTRNYHGRLRRKHPDARLIIYGHTHVRVVDTSCEPWVVNPGAAGRERTKGGPSCLVVDTGTRDWNIEMHCFPGPQLRAST